MIVRLLIALVILVMLGVIVAASLTAREAVGIQRWERQLCLDREGNPVRLYGPHGIELGPDACVFGADSVISLEHPR